MATATLFRGIQKDRVTKKQPASGGTLFDADRCAAIHNTLVLYGWFSSGKKISDLKKRTWWGRHGNDNLKKLLRPQVVRYLSKIFDVPDHNFFYHVSGLASEKAMLQLGDVMEDSDRFDLTHTEKHRFIVLYETSKNLVSHPAGIVFDQQTGQALLMPTYHHVFNLYDTHLPWQKLETILSAYVDMIDANKAMAVHDEAEIRDLDGDAWPAEAELAINAAKPYHKTRPWILQPYTVNDLQLCLDTWTKLVHTIEKKAGIVRQKVNPEDIDPELDMTDDRDLPLCSRTALNIAGIKEGFAYHLLAHAIQSEVWFVAPGIRLPKVEEFLQQPFKHIPGQFPKETRGMRIPFLFLRIPGTVSAKDAKFRYPFSTVESVPCGLYLDAFPNAQNPFEDACRLVLPIRLGGNHYARTSDFKPIHRSYSDLYQVEVNPFVMRHGPKLVAVLESWLENVESGHWSVNDKGVTGGIGVWRQADTRENWWRYQAAHLTI